MKRIPLWGKHYLFYMIGMTVSIAIIVSVVMYQTHREKRDIINTDAKNIAYFVETELNNRFENIEERFGGIDIARSFIAAENSVVVDNYRYSVSRLLETICADSREVLAVFYVDAFGNNYSAGESIGGLDKRTALMEKARKKSNEQNIRNVWIYDKTDKGSHACVLYRDIVYVNDIYEKKYLGSILVYVDSDDISNSYLSGLQKETGVLFVDCDGIIAVSTNTNEIGKEYATYFNKSKNKLYDGNGNELIYRESKSKINGWNTITYFSSDAIAGQTRDTIVLLIIIVVICIVVMGFCFFFVSKWIGKPINELVESISVSGDGQLLISNDLEYDEAQKIQMVIDNITRKLVEQTEINHQKEMQMQISLLKSYENQMNPHFLFNTLQSIQMLSVMGRNEDVNHMLSYLGSMLRFNLSGRNEVTFREEIDNIETYFKILKYRYNDFEYDIVVDEKLYSCKTLKFLLQPFVENSIKHGLQNVNHEWRILITAMRINDEMVIIIKDNGVGIDKEKLNAIKQGLYGDSDTALGIGVNNVNSRIKLTYGKEYGVDIFCHSGTQVIIHFPCVDEV